jgi:hypothetical protein
MRRRGRAAGTSKVRKSERGLWFGENWEDNRLGEDAEMYCMSKKC